MGTSGSGIAEARALVEAAIALQPVLMHQARRIEGAASEDVVQDVRLRLLDAPSIAATEAPGGFVMRMTRNAAIDRVRRTRFEDRTFAPEEEAGCRATPGAGPFERLTWRQMLATVADAIDGPTPRSRAVFCRAWLDGVPQKAVAREFGLSPALVCDFVRRAHTPCVEAAGAGRDAVRRALEAGKAIEIDLRNYRKVGEAFWDRILIEPVHDVMGGGLVFPSRTDTFGNVRLEALAGGTPVAAYPVSGQRDVLAGGDAGVMRDDLGEACRIALLVPRVRARAFSLR